MKHDKKRFPSLTTSGLMRIINFFSIDMWPWLHYEAVWGRWEKGGFCLFVKFASLEQEKAPSCLGLQKRTERHGHYLPAVAKTTTCICHIFTLYLCISSPPLQPIFVIFLPWHICVFPKNFSSSSTLSTTQSFATSREYEVFVCLVS